jgi:N utilization substance protein B
MKRRKAREYALQILFSMENGEGLSSSDIGKVSSEFLANFSPENVEEIADIPFLRKLLTFVTSEHEALDEEIEKFSENWKLYRMTKIDRNIIRIGATELKNFQDVPPKVTIDECVELAKKYGSEDSSAFINGLLDKIRSSIGREAV